MGTSETKEGNESSSEDARDTESEKKSMVTHEENGYTSDTQSFEPTIDMLMQENFDYEYDRSSDESESQMSDINNQDEWERLIEEGEYPIEELRAKYGYSNNNAISEEQQLDYMRCSQRSAVNIYSYNERSSGSEFEGYSKKSVRIGNDYQVIVPDEPSFIKYNSDEPSETLTWEPNICSSDELERIFKYFVKNYSRIPSNDEDVYKLIMKHRGNYERVVNDQATIQNILQKQESALVDFSIEECSLFKEAVLICGKKFGLIRNKFYPTRTIQSLIHFYYIWKKTPAYEDFLREFESRKRKQAAETLSYERENGSNESPVNNGEPYEFQSVLPPDNKIPKFN